MLGKLKDMAGGAAAQKVVEHITPALQPHLDKIKDLNPDVVQDDDRYKQTIVTPALTAVAAGSGGVTAMLPKFSEKFTNAMLHLRDELIVVEGGAVRLVDGFQQRLPAVLMAGIKK